MEEKMMRIVRVCKFCNIEETPEWWKCCARHTSENGTDVVCQKCKTFYHPNPLLESFDRAVARLREILIKTPPTLERNDHLEITITISPDDSGVVSFEFENNSEGEVNDG